MFFAQRSDREKCRPMCAGAQRRVFEYPFRGVSGGFMAEDRARKDRDAVALFSDQAKKWIGAFAAVLGGVDTLVFAGGIAKTLP
jgi:acetate kinase